MDRRVGSLFVIVGVLLVNSMSIELVSVGTWITRPGYVYACVGSDVYFDWEPGDPGIPIPIRFYSYNGSTMASVYTGNKILYYDDYEARVEVSHDNTSFTLKNVTERDSGTYRLHLSGSTWRDEAQLTVLTEADLIPRMFVDNQLIDLAGAEDILVDSENTTNITVSRPSCGGCQHLLLDFIIRVNGNTKRCTNSSDCTYLLDWADLDINQVQLTVTVQLLNSCDVTSGPVTIQHTGDIAAASQSTNVGLIIALVCIGSVVLLVFLLWLALKIKEKKNRSLQSWQKKYVHCLCCAKQQKVKKESVELIPMPEKVRAPSDVEQCLLSDNQTQIVNQNNSASSSKQDIDDEEEPLNRISDHFVNPGDNNDNDENSSSMHESTEDLGKNPATTPTSTAQPQHSNTGFASMVRQSVSDFFLPDKIQKKKGSSTHQLESAAPAIKKNSGQDISATDEPTGESSSRLKDKESDSERNCVDGDSSIKDVGRQTEGAQVAPTRDHRLKNTTELNSPADDHLLSGYEVLDSTGIPQAI